MEDGFLSETMRDVLMVLGALAAILGIVNFLRSAILWMRKRYKVPKGLEGLQKWFVTVLGCFCFLKYNLPLMPHRPSFIYHGLFVPRYKIGHGIGSNHHLNYNIFRKDAKYNTTFFFQKRVKLYIKNIITQHLS